MKQNDIYILEVTEILLNNLMDMLGIEQTNVKDIRKLHNELIFSDALHQLIERLKSDARK